MIAEWRAVVGYEGRYEVSSLGSIRCIALSGRFPRIRELKSSLQFREGRRSSNLIVTLLDGAGVHKTRKVHVLVAAAFIGPRPTGLEINHRDGNTHNNALKNLEYVSHSENMRHSYRMGVHDRQMVVRNAARSALGVRGYADDTAVRAPVHPVGAPFPSALEAPAASDLPRSLRRSTR
jgi:hypothetical protein